MDTVIHFLTDTIIGVVATLFMIGLVLFLTIGGGLVPIIQKFSVWMYG